MPDCRSLVPVNCYLCILFILLLGIIGCAHPILVSQRSEGDIHIIPDVPFFPQERRLCGPASLATLFHFWGRDIALQEIIKDVYLPKLKGTLSIDMENYALKMGFDVKSYKGSISDIRYQISKGRPLIAFLNLGYKIFPIGHYVIIIGYNDKERYIITRSARERTKLFTYDEFLRAWGKTDYWVLLIVPG